MQRIGSLDDSCGYVRDHSLDSEVDWDDTCRCTDLLVIDGAMRCAECGTVWGVVFGWNRYPSRRWRAQRRPGREHAAD